VSKVLIVAQLLPNSELFGELCRDSMANAGKAYIAGKPLLSTTDWPSHVSCVVFFVGCNLRCRFCFNGPLLDFNEQFQIKLTKVYAEIKSQKSLIDGVIVSGGEPTIQPEPLLALAKWTRKQKLLFGLMTNGTRPDVLRQLLGQDLINYIAVDIKTIPKIDQYSEITPISENLLEKIQETISLLKSARVSYEFRTTLVPGLVDQISQVRQIANWLGTEHYVLQVYRPAKTVLDVSLHDRNFTPAELELFRNFAQENQIEFRF
jgi:pyruvate formate lyase activating enzyme